MKHHHFTLLQVLLGKPLMVFGPSPTDCSWATVALMSLIAPVPFAYDFRCAEFDHVLSYLAHKTQSHYFELLAWSLCVPEAAPCD